jgi:hypothetical protein
MPGNFCPVGSTADLYSEDELVSNVSNYKATTTIHNFVGANHDKHF